MNLIEALKSGRPFRRPGWDCCCNGYDDENEQFSLFFEGPQKKLFGMLSTEDILADDWETKPAEVTIDEVKLHMAWLNSLKVPTDRNGPVSDFAMLAKELGL